MFSCCHRLSSLDVSKFNTSNVTNMESMFYYCASLQNLDVNHFDTSNVKDMSNMFSRCGSLTSLDISNFNTSKVIYMNAMFYNCVHLQDLNLGHFETDNVLYMDYMFDRCNQLTAIYLDLQEPFECKTIEDSNPLANLTNCILYVPVGVRTNYLAAGWDAYFKDIVETDMTATSINELGSDIQHSNDADIYSMDGKKFGNVSDTPTLPTGLYIIGGKKILMK